MMTKDSLDFSNYFVVISGAAGDIGQGICEAFKKHKAFVFGTDIKTNQIKNVDKYINGDLNSDSFLSELVTKVTTELTNKNFILINAAGITIPEQNGYSLDNWKKVLDINLTSSFKLIEAFRKLLIDKIRSDKSSIINITSLASGLGFPDNPSYAASKGGLKSLTKSYARDLGQYGVRVNAIAPGYVQTAMTSKSYNDVKLKNDRERHMMLKRWGKPKDIANGCLFLSSELASYITGIELMIDGGWSSNGLTE
jgi:gluconate 5-dehydrogenase/2-deoxy-D-gluconate 3-dehydrogenase